MDQPEYRRQPKARKGHLLSITVLTGVIVMTLGAVSAVSVYLNRLGSSVEAMAQAAPLSDYAGRPQKRPQPNGVPLDYLIMVTDGSGELASVHLVHLSASREKLTLVGVPSDLTLGSLRLVDLYARDPSSAAQQVELLLQTRTDHQARLDLNRVTSVVDALGGLSLPDADAKVMTGAAGDGRASGRQVLDFVESARGGAERVDRVSDLVHGVLTRLGMTQAVANPYQFDRVLKELEYCFVVDSNVTLTEFESILIESRVRADEIATVTLHASADGRLADPSALTALRSALAADDLSRVSGPIVTRAPTAASSPR
jgi:anionic cell wall polymer biosynthesis LytR-Cps2A-Psr (LCP) family protein